MNFEEIARDFEATSSKAKVTLMYKLLQFCGAAALRTIIKYCCQRLDYINAQIPDDHPDKQKWLNYGRHKKLEDLGPVTELNIYGAIELHKQEMGGLGMSIEQQEKW